MGNRPSLDPARCVEHTYTGSSMGESVAIVNRNGDPGTAWVSVNSDAGEV